jgi:DNA invertase Pin-like site-specific DNA recombinase
MLMDRKVDFVCCDNPTATKFTIHILAAVAEHERDAISARTKAALAAAKANGKKLGNYQRIAEAKQRATAARDEAVRGAIAATAHLSTRAAADALNRRGITTASGRRWHAMQVRRARHRLGLG